MSFGHEKTAPVDSFQLPKISTPVEGKFCVQKAEEKEEVPF